MRYNDQELYELSVSEINDKKLGLSANEFFMWSINRLTVLVEASVQPENWLDPDVEHLRRYRTKAIENFFRPKLVTYILR